MKKTLLLITFVFGSSYSAFAGACNSDTLADYITEGSCTIGDLTFSDFGYSDIQDGAVAPSTSTITVAPATSGTGLDFSSVWIAATDQFAQSTITYTVTTTNPGGITDLDLVLGNTTITAGSGVATAEELSSAPTLFTTLGPGSNIPEDSTVFPPVDTLNLTKIISVSGGATGGVAQIGSVLNLFSEGTSPVPEPSLLILFTGLLAIIPVARRKFVH
jgi:hypothetical protein